MDSVPLLTVASTGSEKNGKRWVGATSSLGWMPSGAESVQETLIHGRQIHKLGLSGDDGLDTHEARTVSFVSFQELEPEWLGLPTHWLTQNMESDVSPSS